MSDCEKKEIWKKIVNKNLSKYSISNMGNIKNYKNQIVKPEIRNGYYKVVLNNDTSTGRRKKVGYYIHHLMMDTFTENKFNYKNILHLDNNLLNNKICNLQWDTEYKYENEIWEPFPIDNFTNYQLSNYGRIKNKNKYLNPEIYKGLYRINLFDDDKNRKYFMVHLLVAKKFIKNPNDDLHVIHIDKNTLNNFCENLKWGIINDDKFYNELWKTIELNTSPNIYEISNMGRYRNKFTGEILANYKCNKYLMASLYTKEKMIRESVHRLVAKAFVHNSNPIKFNIVNHLDGNKFNNKSSNLEWTDQSGNMIHAFRTLKVNSTSKQIIQINVDNTRVLYNSITEVCQDNKISSLFMRNCLNGTQKSLNGIKWIYANNVKEFNTNNVLEEFDINKFEEIKNFPEYFISLEGKIYSKKSNKFLTYNYADYPSTNLSLNGKPISKFVHRLVAEQFIPNKENKKVVNHIDSNKNNYHYLNLEWVTHSENAIHSIKNIMTKKSIVLKEASKDIPGDGENSSESQSIL